MNDPAAPRDPKGWPLLAIAVVIVLLAGFLVLKWRKREDAPALVKEPPKLVESAKPVEAPKEDVGNPIKEKPEALPGPQDVDFAAKVSQLKKALEAKNWDDASAALEAARKLRADAAELKGI